MTHQRDTPFGLPKTTVPIQWRASADRVRLRGAPLLVGQQFAGLREYADHGFVLHESVFTDTELEVLRKAAQEELTASTPRRTVDEKTGVPYRAHGSHEHHPVFHRLVRDPRLLKVATGLLGDDVYVHQFKINSKIPFTGDQWGWHQDFTFWHLEDGMPAPWALTAAVLLDKVTEFNGPLILVPGAHRSDTLVTPARSEGWSATTTNALKYNLADSTELPDLIDRHGMIAPKAPAGSVLWFHCNIPHASGNNMSPYGPTPPVAGPGPQPTLASTGANVT